MKKNPKIAKFYKEQAGIYSNFAPESFSWRFVEKPSFDRYLVPLLRKNMKILDVGCGDGRIVRYLLSKGIRQEKITGIDLSNDLIEIARREIPGVKFINANILDSRISFENLDVITSCMVLFYLDNQQLKKSMRRFYEWLKKGGILFYIVGHPIRFAHKNIKEYFIRDWWMQETSWGTKIPHFRRTLGDYINITIQAGFTISLVVEPEVLKEGKRFPKEYKKYSSFPSRLVIKATKT